MPALELLRRNGDFRRVYLAELSSFGGDWFASVALLGLVLDLTNGSGLAAAGVFMAATLPQALATVVAGPAADRFDRRRLAVAVSVAQAVVALGFLAVGPGRLWVAYAVQGGISFLGAFIGPAVLASVPNLVEPDDLPIANMLLGSVWGTMLAVGASLGGAFTALFGRNASFVADAVTFLVTAALLASVRRPMQGGSRSGGRLRPLADTAETVRFARRHPAVLALLGSKLGFGLAGGVVTVLPLLATETFRAGDTGTGLLLGARGVGVVLGPVLAGRLGRRGIDGILLACGVSALVFAAAYALVPIAPALGLACLVVGIGHLGGGAQWTLSTLGLQLTVADEVRGRIMSADFALVSAALAVSFPTAGALAGWLGPGTAILCFALVAAVWGAVYLVLTRAVRADAAALVAQH